MRLLVLGTSNCVGPLSFVNHLGRSFGFEVTNLSIGASSSNAGLYLAGRCAEQPYDVALVDYQINDAVYAHHGVKDAEDIRTNLSSIFATLRRHGCMPLVLILPRTALLTSSNAAADLHIKTCRAEAVPFLDLARLFRAARQRGAAEPRLFRDPDHIAIDQSYLVARCVARAVEALRPAARRTTSVRSWVRRVRPVSFADPAHRAWLGPDPTLVERASSQRRAAHAVLPVGRTFTLPVGAGEGLFGLLINAGAGGSIVTLQGEGPAITKSLVICFDTARASAFRTLMVDLKPPVRGEAGTVRLTAVPADMPVTEPTPYATPIDPARYGAIEIEGALIGDVATQFIQSRVETVAQLDLAATPDFTAIVDDILRIASPPRPEDQMAAGDATGAERSATELVELNPADYAAFETMIRLCVAQNRLEEARGWCQRHIAVEPGNGWRYDRLTTVLLRLGDMDAALGSARQAAALLPGEAYPAERLRDIAARAGVAV